MSFTLSKQHPQSSISYFDMDQAPDASRLVRDTIPGDVCRLRQDSVDAQDLPTRLKIPTKEADVPYWAFVASIPASVDMSRQFVVYHVPLAEDELAHYQVGVRVIAPLGHHNFQGMGNWDGLPRNACKAVHYVELVPGPLPDQFAVQRDALCRLSDFAERGLFAQQVIPSLLSREDEVIHASHRVFTKMTRETRDMSSVLTLADDPERLAQAAGVVNNWRVTSKLMLGERRLDGKVYPLHPLRFSEGDLVDVRMKFDIATVRRRDGIPVTKVHLSFDQVIQLCPVDQQEQRMFLPRYREVMPAIEVLDVYDTQFEEQGD